MRVVATFAACIFAFIALYALMFGGHGPTYFIAAAAGAMMLIAICIVIMKSPN